MHVVHSYVLQKDFKTKEYHLNRLLLPSYHKGLLSVFIYESWQAVETHLYTYRLWAFVRMRKLYVCIMNEANICYEWPSRFVSISERVDYNISRLSFAIARVHTFILHFSHNLLFKNDENKMLYSKNVACVLIALMDCYKQWIMMIVLV